jgi:hypothetical protein
MVFALEVEGDVGAVCFPWGNIQVVYYGLRVYLGYEGCRRCYMYVEDSVCVVWELRRISS